MNSLERPGIAPIIEHFGGLPAQPKKEIAGYIASLGLAVPEIYADLHEAIASGEPFMARGEHPYELYYSGLGTSYPSSTTDSDQRVIRTSAEAFGNPLRNFDTVLKDTRANNLDVLDANMWRIYAMGGEFSGTEADDFARQHSLSYWRTEPGENLFMIEDSGRPNRYYVGRVNRHQGGYAVIEDGKITAKAERKMKNEWTLEPDKLVEWYKTIRTQTFLDPQNVPLVELVDPGTDKPPVFLQLLPTQQQVAADFAVRHKSDGVYLVRGATPEDGMEVKLWYGTSGFRERNTQEAHGIAASRFHDKGEREACLPGLTFSPLRGYKNHGPQESNRSILLATVDHGLRSEVFRPQITVVLEDMAYAALMSQTSRFGTNKPMHITSNGTDACIQYYDESKDKIVKL